MGLDMIYTEIIMEHSKNMDNRRELDDKTHHEHGHNPSCGDDIELELNVQDGVIEDAAFTGTGCAISMASTSMMIDLIKGEELEVAHQKVKDFLSMIKSEKTVEEVEDTLLDATMLSPIKTLPARVKCAVLAWHTLDELINKM